jgi:hypothetical protein
LFPVRVKDAVVEKAKARAHGAKPGGMRWQMGGLIDSLGAAAGRTGSGEMPLLMLVVSDENARSVMAPQNANNALFSGIFKAAEPDAKGAQFGGQIDTLIRIIAGPVPDADAKSIDLARLVLKRL